MKISVLLLTLCAVIGFAVPVAASQDASLRAQIETFVDERGLPEDADRACVVDRAVQEHPNVPLMTVGPRPPAGPAREQHDENLRRIRVALAVDAAIKLCAASPVEGT
ncbi:MAG: hypothetical protein V7672_09325 [Brevundimonas sp.]|uniref:hypothetical protein n=1 Tax=Brevundimonas sp. TaxID=1871086 RepID=UPI003001A88E